MRWKRRTRQNTKEKGNDEAKLGRGKKKVKE